MAVDRLKTLRTFVSVAENASFAEAARRLNTSPSAVTRTIADLEGSIGIPLLVRTTRSVRLTPEGAAFLDRCKSGLGEIDLAFDEVRGRSGAPQGTLTVTAPVMFGRLHVLPIVTELLAMHSELQVRLLLLDRVVNLIEEGVDVAVRIAELEDSSLHMLRIGQVDRVLCGSPDYLAARGTPKSLADLRNHEVIAINDELGPRSLDLRGWRKLTRQPRLWVNSVEAGIAASVSGLGLVRTLSYQVVDQVAAGSLLLVLTEQLGPPLPISLLFQRGRMDRPNVRAFIDAARRRLSGTRI